MACQLHSALGPQPGHGGGAGLQRGPLGCPGAPETLWDMGWGPLQDLERGLEGDSCRGAVLGSLGVQACMETLLCLVMRQRPT